MDDSIDPQRPSTSFQEPEPPSASAGPTADAHADPHLRPFLISEQASIKSNLHTVTYTWETFVAARRQIVRLDRRANEDLKTTKERAPAWTAMLYVDNAWRDNRNALHRMDGVVVVELDHLNLIAFDEVTALLASCGITNYWHTTFSHAPPDDCRMRIILLVDRPVLEVEWYTLRLWLQHLLGGRIDEKAWSAYQPMFVRSALRGATGMLDGETRGVALPVREAIAEAEQLGLKPAAGFAVAEALTDKEIDSIPLPTRIEEAERRLAVYPPAVMGEGADPRTYGAAQIGFLCGVPKDHFWPLLCTWNKGNTPPWCEETPDPASGRRGTLRQKLERGYSSNRIPWGGAVAYLAGDAPRLEAVSMAQLPPFPLHALPPEMAAYAVAVAHSYQVAIDMAAMLMLACASATAQRTWDVAVRPDWIEPLGLFVLVVLPPGARKSPVFREVTAPIRFWEERQAQEVERENASKRVRAQSLKDTITAAQKAKKYNDVFSATMQLDNEKEVPAPRVLADDCTQEKLAAIMEEQGGAIAVMSGEGATPFELMRGRYRERAAFEVYLKGHGGDALRVDRLARPSVYVPQPRMTMGLCVQPEVIADIAEIPGARGKGLLARFLYVFPADLVGTRSPNPESVPNEVRQKYHLRLLSLLRTGSRCALPFDQLAQHHMSGFLEIVEPRRGRGGDLAEIVDWASKAEGTVARIAAVLALLSGKNIVDEATFFHAVEIVDYLIAHAQLAYRRMRGDPIKRVLADPVAAAIVELVGVRTWEGSPAELLAALAKVAGVAAKSRDWPQGARGLRARLDALAPGLADVGIVVEHYRSTARSRKRMVRLTQRGSDGRDGPSDEEGRKDGTVAPPSDGPDGPDGRRRVH